MLLNSKAFTVLEALRPLAAIAALGIATPLGVHAQDATSTTLQVGPRPHQTGLPVSMRARVAADQVAPDGMVAFYSGEALLAEAQLAGGQLGSASIASTAYGTCVLTLEGGIRCWGSDSYGQNSIAQLSAPVVGLAGGYGHYCALTQTGAVFCAGYNHYGQLGDGTRRDRDIPVQVVGLDSGVTAITARFEHTCALLETGELRCWGANYGGQFGDGTDEDSEVPVLAAQGMRFTRVAAGAIHTCGIAEDRSLYCWGSNSWGNIGTGGSGTSTFTPQHVSRIRAPVTDVVAGYYHTCALTDAGAVWCWGRNEYGQIGDGTRTDAPFPQRIANIGRGSTSLTANLNNTCAIRGNGRIQCWGEFWALGSGSEMDAYSPVFVSRIPSARPATAVSLGWQHACAIRYDGRVSCWGRDIGGSNGGGGESLTPIPVPGGRFAAVRGEASASVEVTDLPAGIHQLRATYLGSDAFDPSESPFVRYRVR